MKYRLTESHPLHDKVQQISDLAESLGVHIYFAGLVIIVTDLETGKEYHLKDIESSGNDTHTSLPFSSEWKLTFEK